jgi:hypothetical protein
MSIHSARPEIMNQERSKFLTIYFTFGGFLLY